MLRCTQCRGEVGRRPRTRLQRLVYSGVFRCRSCDLRIAMLHPFLQHQIVYGEFLFSFYTRCVRCAIHTVTPLKKRDHIDPVTKNPLGLFQRLLGAPLKHCEACRLQYYDWRPVRTPKEVADQTRSTIPPRL